MIRLIVVERPERWPFRIPGVDVVAAREYLTAERWAEPRRGTKSSSVSSRSRMAGSKRPIIAGPGTLCAQRMSPRAVWR